jgi:hypothetical protein
MPLDYFARNDHAVVYSIIRAIIHYKLSAFAGHRPVVCTPDNGASGSYVITNEMAHVIKKLCLDSQLFFRNRMYDGELFCMQHSSWNIRSMPASVERIPKK